MTMLRKVTPLGSIWMVFLVAAGNHIWQIAGSEYHGPESQSRPQVFLNSQERIGRQMWHKEYHKVEESDDPVHQLRRPPARGPLPQEDHWNQGRPPLNNLLEAWNVPLLEPQASNDHYYYPTDEELIRDDIVGPPLTFWDFQHAEDLGSSVSKFRSDVDPIEIAGLHEGDIRHTQNAQHTTNYFRNAIRDPYYRWPNGIIPYDISTYYDKQERATIALAMKNFHEKTCIRFVPRTVEKDYIHILKHDGCSSSVGRVGRGQVVSLGINCVHGGIAMHELMHAAGFWHEHSRNDRDDFVDIRWNNIESDKKYNFKKYNWTTIQNLGYPYDLGSVMHFGPYAFAIDRKRPTIITHSGKKIGQRNGLSKIDIGKLNRLYECGPNYSTPPDEPEPLRAVTTQSPLLSGFNCIDGNIHCEQWGQNDECSSNSAWMSLNCQLTCGKCQENVGIERPAPPPPPPPEPCVDENKHCLWWAEEGECQYNADWMGIYCKASCRLCKSGPTTFVAENLVVPSEPCEDSNIHCQVWAQLGECNRNPEFMLSECIQSCLQC